MQLIDRPRDLYPLVSVDIALFCIEDHRLKVLLVQRATEPHANCWALPGGVLRPDIDDSLEAAAVRVLRQKISVEIPYLAEVCTYSGPMRDPRGWSISTLYYALLPRDKITAVVANRIEAIKWEDAEPLGQRLAFDHDLQLAAALQLLREKVEGHALPLHLMPELFTLTQLQNTCEAILGKGQKLDKSVFRRRIKGHPDLTPTDQEERGRQRPALLYRARNGFCFERFRQQTNGQSDE